MMLTVHGHMYDQWPTKSPGEENAEEEEGRALPPALQQGHPVIEADETSRADLGVCVCNVHTHVCKYEYGSQCGHQMSFLADFHLIFCNSLSLNLELIWLGCLASERQGFYSSFQSPGVTDTCCHTWLLGVLDIST